VAEAAATPRQLHDLAVRRVVDFQVALCALLLDDDRRQAMPLGLSRSLLRTLLCRGQLQPKLGFCLARRTCRACIHCWRGICGSVAREDLASGQRCSAWSAY